MQGVTPNLITSDPIAVRGENGQTSTKVPVEFVCSEGGHLSGATSQMVEKGGTCSTVTPLCPMRAGNLWAGLPPSEAPVTAAKSLDLHGARATRMPTV